MFKTISILWRIDNHTKINIFFYYFRKIPLLQNLLPKHVYDMHKTKTAISFLTALGQIFIQLFQKIFFCAVVLCVPVYMMRSELLFHDILHIFMIISLCMGPILSSRVGVSDKDAYIGVQIFKIEGRHYIFAQMFFHYVKDFIFLFLVYSLLGYTLNISSYPIISFIMCVYYICAHLAGDALRLFHYQKTYRIDYKMVPQLLYTFICLVAAYGPLAFAYEYPAIMLLISPFMMMVVLCIGIFSFLYLLNYKHYISILKDGFLKNQLYYDRTAMMNSIRFNDVKLNDNIDTSLPASIQKKSGYDYLNAIFFQRQKKLLLKPVKICSAIVIAIFIFLTILALFMPSDTFEADVMLVSGVPYMVFWMYSMNVTEKLCRAMFANCDMALLRYSYYRERNVILKNFKYRLKRVCLYNLIIAGVMCVCTIIALYVSALPFAWHNYLLFAVCIMMLSVFFSVHHLCMYYVFQPFTTENGMKNPFYSIINTLMYLFCLFCLQFKNFPSYFAIVIFIFTLMYIVISLLSVMHWAPKNFRVK